MAKRRANGEGSLRKRKDGRWEGRYTAGTDPVTGKAIIKNVLGKTQAEVKEKLKKAIAESGELDIKRSGMYTVGEWMDLWYEVYAKPRIRESTSVYYKMFIDTHIRPKLGDIKLNQLQTMDIQRLYNELRENGRIRKEIKDKQPGLSVSYIRGMHNMLKACLNSAVEERLILRNPAEGCKLPKAEKKEMKVLTQEQLGSYLAAADKRGLLPMFFLELTTGLRKGKLVPLLWSDVDTANMTLSISKQAYRTKGALTVQPPKTDNSIRKISLSSETIELLKQEHDKHPSNPYLFPLAGKRWDVPPRFSGKAPSEDPQGCRVGTPPLPRSAAHLRNPGLAERNRCKNRVQYAGSQQRRFHPRHLHPCYKQGTGAGSGEDRKLAEAGALTWKDSPEEKRSLRRPQFGFALAFQSIRHIGL